jgi:transcriptional regulator with XRE-family HTH domain
MMTDTQVDQLIDSIRNTMTVDDLSAAEVARQSGFSEGYVSQLLNRSRLDRKINPGPVLVIAHALGLVRIVEEDAR